MVGSSFNKESQYKLPGNKKDQIPILEPLSPGFSEFEQIRESIINSIDRSINSVNTLGLNHKDLEEILRHYHFGYIGQINKETVNNRLQDIKEKLSKRTFMEETIENFSLMNKLRSQDDQQHIRNVLLLKAIDQYKH